MTALPGLSNGQFDHHDPEFIANPWPTYQHLRQSCPVSHSQRYGGFWLVTRYDDVVAAAADWQTFTSSVPGTLLIPAGMQRSFPFLPLEYDPPEHTLYRQLVAPVFSPRRVNGLATSIRALADALLAPLLAAGGGDLVTDLAAPLTSGTLAMFIGLPDEDKELWIELVRRSFEGSVRDPEDAARAGAEFRDYIDRLIADRQKERSDDLISLLLDAEVDGRRLTEDQIRGFTMLILVAGHETTAAALSYALWHLAGHPADLARLRDDRPLIPSAVEEFLRLSSPVSIFARNVSSDTDFRGQRISGGDVVGLSFSSANRDEERFSDPESCQLDRRPNRHLAFGSGVHFCLGAQMARREISVAMEAVLDSNAQLTRGADIRRKGRGDALALAHLPISFSYPGRGRLPGEPDQGRDLRERDVLGTSF